MAASRKSLILLFALSLVGCRHETHEREEPGRFLVTSPLRESAELTQEYVAQIRAVQHIELRALERGYLQGIFVDEGQRIEKGARMFQIMPLIYQAEVQKAQAETDLTKIEYDNTKLLADENIVSQNELKLSKAKLEKARAELSLAAAHKGLTEIRAPFSGIMGRFQVRLGSLVDEGDPLTTLSDNDSVWVYFNVSEAEYLEYQAAGREVGERKVRLVMANGQVFDQEGTVETIEADFDNETGNIAFRATFPNPKGLLRHGQTGKVRMAIPLQRALLIPQKATFEVLDKKFVFVVDDQGVVRSRPISVAAELPQLFVVESGLEEDDRILVDGLRKVRDGSVVVSDYKRPAEVFAKLEVPAE